MKKKKVIITVCVALCIVLVALVRVLRLIWADRF
jgi:hypothetical protein